MNRKPQTVTRRARAYAAAQGYKFAGPALAEVSWADGYRAAVRRFRELCDLIDRYADAQTTREKAQLTRAIHGLAYGAKDLSARHRRRNARQRNERGAGVLG